MASLSSCSSSIEAENSKPKCRLLQDSEISEDGLAVAATSSTICEMGPNSSDSSKLSSSEKHDSSDVILVLEGIAAPANSTTSFSVSNKVAQPLVLKAET
ncbi:hypothetical protein TKK_0000789 [Trichogramma kaykai]|uniref:Uncharacterized protein n=1 Tax=Trichogramma kaykai TaxID=54128 RepID=A0ABD2WQU8_9HYME